MRYSFVIVRWWGGTEGFLESSEAVERDAKDGYGKGAWTLDLWMQRWRAVMYRLTKSSGQTQLRG
jgi:hypothetical protein